MNNFTFLDEDQVFGNNQLDILKKYGTKCAMTDFSILVGGVVSNDDYTSEGNNLKDRTGSWWTKTFHDCHAVIVDYDGDKENSLIDSNWGVRPAIPYFLIQANDMNARINDKGIKEVEYGEYPQTVVDEDYSRKLEKAYKKSRKSRISATGKEFSDFDKYNDSRIPYYEYQYDGNKYVRIEGHGCSMGHQLSDGRIVELGKAYWVRVEPITWLLDEKTNIALSKKILFYNFFSHFYEGRPNPKYFDETSIKRFMDNYFAQEIGVERVNSQSIPEEQTQDITQDIEEQEPLRKQNPYDFNFDEVTEEDIIKGAIESNVSVFLHGRSSEGKSARVKQLDPDCEIIYMRNATPDSLNGKSVYNAETGEMIDVPPTWYSKIKEKCEEEPEKIHIIFFDELTNALPSIQGMAFNIVLDGEVNGKWKLPSNARIVAAGNDLDDSLAANQMAEPLFNRFAHVYIETTVDSWLKWASTPKEEYERLDYEVEEPEAKIHPSVYAYIAYKSYTGNDVLRTKYTGDKPNADPRKWEMASKVLYKTKKPEMLRALVGEELTRDFAEFAKEQVITIDDVINHNYSSRDLEMNVAQKFATAVGLSSVDEENFEVVRDFMKQIGAEPRAAFESIWAHGDERRLEKLAEIQMEDNLSQGGIRR